MTRLERVRSRKLGCKDPRDWKIERVDGKIPGGDWRGRGGDLRDLSEQQNAVGGGGVEG
jgi:hypothetical protein